MADVPAAARIAAIMSLAAIVMFASPVRAADTACAIPDTLALRDIALPDARKAAIGDHHLVVLTFGGVRPAGADADTQGVTYPARLDAFLSAALPEVMVAVVNEIPPGKTAADVPPVLPDMIAKTGARLVIWGPGSRDVAAGMDAKAFGDALTAGVEATRRAGADLILLDMTFVPSPARMAQIESYRQALRSVATTNHVPLLRRHDMMRLWSEDGTLNLSARDPEERQLVARHLFACVARSLAEPIAAAIR